MRASGAARRPAASWAWAVVLAMGSSACGNDDGGPIADAGAECSIEPTLSSLASKVFATPSCNILGCHAEPTSSGELDLSANLDGLYDQLVLTGSTASSAGRGRYPRRVVPGAPEQSFLWIKLTDPNAPGDSGRMPPGSALDDCALDATRGWIEAGASKN